jgi:LysR family glycine cleavage system transcriptional activator
MARPRLPPLNAIKAFEAAARLGSFTHAATELGVTHGAVSRQIGVLEDWLGRRLFVRTSRNAMPSEAGTDLLAAVKPALDELAGAAERLRSRPMRDAVRISALPTFAMRWLIPRLSEFQREHPGIELRIVTASTAAAQFQMDVDAVISGPAQRPGWVGHRFLGEARLPLASPELIRRCPINHPADLARHTFLHSATLPDAWQRWLAEIGLPELRPAREQVYEHFYFAIQAALEGLGVLMGPVALVADELRHGRLTAPIPEPALRTRGYYIFARRADADTPELIALQQWLVDAGRQTERDFARYLAPQCAE